jgi:hypothetical protein
MRENSEQITSKLLHQGLWQSAVLLIRNGTQEVDEACRPILHGQQRLIA